MNRIHALLEVAVEPPAEIDVAGDLRRGHRALHRRRTRWAAAGIGGGLVVAGAAGHATWPRLHQTTVQPGAGPTSSAPIRTKYFDAPPAPDGWHLEASRQPFLSMIPDGTASTDIWSFDHKIVVILNPADEWLGRGPTTRYDGRTFYDNERNAGSSILAVRLDDRRWLQLQYPKSAGLGTAEMIAFLDGVVVHPAACVGYGC